MENTNKDEFFKKLTAGNSKAAMFKERCENFMETYKEDPLLFDTIPSITSDIMHNEFGINIYSKSTVPLVFVTGWEEVLKYVSQQNADEYSIEIGGVQLEYITEYSESDKPTNIVPQMYHKREPIFSSQNVQTSTGSNYNNELLVRYNAWRSVNLTETITSLETTVFKKLFDEYGVDLIVPAAVFPMMSATYAAGLIAAKTYKTTINMYNIFDIDIYDGSQIVLSPLAFVKQWLKNDSKKI